MTKRHDSFCEGCAILPLNRKNLPADYTDDQPIAVDQFTVHFTAGDPRKFIFRGDPARQDRVYL